MGQNEFKPFWPYQSTCWFCMHATRVLFPSSTLVELQLDKLQWVINDSPAALVAANGALSRRLRARTCSRVTQQWLGSVTLQGGEGCNKSLGKIYFHMPMSKQKQLVKYSIITLVQFLTFFLIFIITATSFFLFMCLTFLLIFIIKNTNKQIIDGMINMNNQAA